MLKALKKKFVGYMAVISTLAVSLVPSTGSAFAEGCCDAQDQCCDNDNTWILLGSAAVGAAVGAITVACTKNRRHHSSSSSDESSSDFARDNTDNTLTFILTLSNSGLVAQQSTTAFNVIPFVSEPDGTVITGPSQPFNFVSHTFTLKVPSPLPFGTYTVGYDILPLDSSIGFVSQLALAAEIVATRKGGSTTEIFATTSHVVESESDTSEFFEQAQISLDFTYSPEPHQAHRGQVIAPVPNP